MIGTIPKGRGKGIGKNMTEHLLMEAKEYKAKACVLHASICKSNPCVIEVDGEQKYACSTTPKDGMDITVNRFKKKFFLLR